MKLEEIRKLIDEATPGPWKPFGNTLYFREVSKKKPGQDGVDYFVLPGNQETIAFIAASRDLLPKLLAVAEAAKRKRIWDGINCPACSMSGDSDGVPCYCFDQIKAGEDLDKALSALEGTSEGEK